MNMKTVASAVTRGAARTWGWDMRIRAYLAAATVAFLAFAVTPHRADAAILSYHFTPDASYTFGSSGTDHLAGGFTWNTSTDGPASVNFTVTGPLGAGTYTIPKAIQNNQFFALDSAGDKLDPVFVSSLDLDMPDLLKIGFDGGGENVAFVLAGGGFFPATAATGGVDTVPEPATWAMMLVGFCGLGAAMRNRRRKQAIAAV